MTLHQEEDAARLAYEMAWQQFREIPILTPDEKIAGPDKLRAYVAIMIDAGDRDPLKIARSALGILRRKSRSLDRKRALWTNDCRQRREEERH
jgi:hypothetical protein